MSVFVLDNAKVEIAPTTGGAKFNLSPFVRTVTLTYERDAVETTAMGATGHVFAGGLQNLSVSVEVNNSQTLNGVLDSLYAAVGTGTTELTISNTTTVGTQKFTITNAYLAASTPVNGSVGELATQSVNFTGGQITKGTV